MGPCKNVIDRSAASIGGQRPTTVRNLHGSFISKSWTSSSGGQITAARQQGATHHHRPIDIRSWSRATRSARQQQTHDPALSQAGPHQPNPSASGSSTHLEQWQTKIVAMPAISFARHHHGNPPKSCPAPSASGRSQSQLDHSDNSNPPSCQPPGHQLSTKLVPNRH
ncbi:hypothetical protein ACLOJK_035000 [Asimina triloba]